MRKFLIRKRNGTVRVIYSPGQYLKEACRAALPRLEEIVESFPASRFHHGFMRGRSPVTNAMQHYGLDYTLNFDIQDFFDSVTYDKVLRVLPVGRPYHLPEAFFPDGAARQGLPTSPLLAVLSVMPMTAEIASLTSRGRLGIPFTFTFYADDITMSFPREATARWLKEIIPPLVERHGFKVNPAKTRLQSARAGRRIITGVAVDDEVHAPRKIRRRMRAAAHQRNWPQLRGLREWAMLRMPWNYQEPTPPPEEAQVVRTVEITYVAADTYVHATFIRRIV
jgi:hypothetical protein